MQLPLIKRLRAYGTGSWHLYSMQNYCRNSNIGTWSNHKIKKDGAISSHEVHRHDQFLNNSTTDGIDHINSSLVAAWGYPLGNRDRAGRIVGVWKPNNAGITFLGNNSKTRWNSWGHVSKRIAAETSHSIHAFNKRQSHHPIVGSEIKPAAIYTRKFQKNLL